MPATHRSVAAMIGAVAARPSIVPVERWCCMTVVGPCGAVLRASVLGGHGRPDLAAVDVIARHALWASRAGGRLVLSDVVPELRELLVLAELPVVVDGEGS